MTRAEPSPSLRPVGVGSRADSRPRPVGVASRADSCPRPLGVASRADSRPRGPTIVGRGPARPGAAHHVDPSCDSGQAAVELVAFLPLLLAVALTAAALLAGHAAAEQAGQAAQAGAMALLQDRDPREAARRALPDDARATVVVEDRRVTVTVRPRLPVAPVAAAMTARETAHAGPEPP